MAEPNPIPQPAEEPIEKTAPTEDPFKSEFLSEESPDFDTLRRESLEKRADVPVLPPPVDINRKRPVTLTGPVTVPVRPPLPPAPKPAAAKPVPWGWLLLIVAAVGAAPAYILYQNRPGQTAADAPVSATREGVATIDSRPAGAVVFIDGVQRGVTPLRLSLPVGVYAVELRSGSASKSISMRIDPGETLRESIELVPTVTSGRLDITSEPPGGRVLIDGTAVGVTPLSIPSVSVGAHRITVTANGNTASRLVVVEAGATASVMLTPQAPPVAPGVSGGWVTIQAPFEMQVLEGGQVVGTSDAARIMLPVGRHDLQLRATRFGFETTASVDITAGRSVVVPVSVPNGRLSVNASPWAEVFLDGQALGQTPVANISVPIGVHQIIWRHPQFGERRDTVNVAADAPARLGIDMATGRLLGR